MRLAEVVIGETYVAHPHRWPSRDGYAGERCDLQRLCQVRAIALERPNPVARERQVRAEILRLPAKPHTGAFARLKVGDEAYMPAALLGGRWDDARTVIVSD